MRRTTLNCYSVGVSLTRFRSSSSIRLFNKLQFQTQGGHDRFDIRERNLPTEFRIANDVGAGNAGLLGEGIPGQSLCFAGGAD